MYLKTVISLLFLIIATGMIIADDVVQSLTLWGEESLDFVVYHNPKFSWTVTPGYSQFLYEIELGTDNDWTIAEKWQPGEIYSFDKFSDYAGDSLYDGETYYTRIRVSDGGTWSNWYEISFRMNHSPTTPVLLLPGPESMSGGRPYFWIENSTDGDGETLTYDFIIGFDSLCTCVLAGNSTNIVEGIDSTGWESNVVFNENDRLYWRASARDEHERSFWSATNGFWINETEDFPTDFDPVYPPDTGWSQIYEFPIDFHWNISYDRDPYDSVFYRLIIADNSEFENATIIDSLYNYFTTPSELNWQYGTHYWWKVQAVDTKGNTTECSTADFMTWVLGDANRDNSANIGDAVFVINLVFKGGPEAEPKKIADINGDCSVNIGDAVYMVTNVFKNGDPPKIGCAQ